jgi:hypothetical protein
MYVGLTFSVPGVTFDLDSFGFEVLIRGSSGKHNAAPKKQSVKINPVVFVFMRPIESGSPFPVNISLFRGRTIWIADAHRGDAMTFEYKTDTTRTPQFGLVAEHVASIDPNLVVRDDKGEIYSGRCVAVNAMLLNEFLKEHRKNEEQEKTIAELKSGMTALIATLKEQAAQIQKVSAQLEANKPASQVVNNP